MKIHSPSKIASPRHLSVLKIALDFVVNFDSLFFGESGPEKARQNDQQNGRQHTDPISGQEEQTDFTRWKNDEK